MLSSLLTPLPRHIMSQLLVQWGYRVLMGGLGENSSSMTTILNRISTQPGCKFLVHPEWLELYLPPNVSPGIRCSGLGMSQWVP